MRLTVLAENTSRGENILPEHGLSLFLETAEGKLLFDMGQTELFAKNAGVLGVCLGEAELAVLSHGHYDHGGGLAEFLRLNEKARVFVSKYAFGNHCNALDKYIGLDPALKGEERLIFTDGVTELGHGLKLYGGKTPGKLCTLGARGMQVIGEKGPEPDDFCHEQYLLAEENGKRYLFSGCSHRGAAELAAYFSPDVFVGGFHYSKVDAETPEGRELLAKEAEALLKVNCKYYTCHCTGTAQFEYLKGLMGPRIEYISAGQRLDI